MKSCPSESYFDIAMMVKFNSISNALFPSPNQLNSPLVPTHTFPAFIHRRKHFVPQFIKIYLRNVPSQLEDSNLLNLFFLHNRHYRPCLITEMASFQLFLFHRVFSGLRITFNQICSMQNSLFHHNQFLCVYKHNFNTIGPPWPPHITMT